MLDGIPLEREGWIDIAVGLGVGVAAGVLAGRRRQWSDVVVLAALAAALLLRDRSVAWVAGAFETAVAVSVGVVSARGLDRLAPPPWLPGVVAVVSLVGVWAGVPEVNHTLVAGGVVVGCSLVGRATGTVVGAPVLAGVVVWAAVQGSGGDGWPLVGGLACGGVALLAGVAGRGPAVPAVLAVHAVLVVVAARLVGVAEAPVLGVVLWLAVAAGFVLVSRRRRAPGGPPPDPG